MARAPSRSTVLAPALSLLSCLVLSALTLGSPPAVAQDTWWPFGSEKRRDRDGGGFREGDRPLEPKGGARSSDEPQGYDAPRAPARSAAPVAVERGELAPLPEPPPAALAPPPVLSQPPPSQWETRTAPSAPLPDAPLTPATRQSDLAPSSGLPAGPPFLKQRGAFAPPPARTTARAPLEGIATLEPKLLESIVDGLELPSKSAAIATLWPEPWRGSEAMPPAIEAIRIEALRRAGAIEALKSVLERVAPLSEPAQAIILLRAQLLVGNREAGCALAGEAIRNRASLPAPARRDAVLAAGYCALAGGNAEAGKLTVGLIRAENIEASFAQAVLEGAGAKGKAPPALPATVGVLDYRIGEAAGIVWPGTLVERAEPAVLALVATGQSVDPGLKLAAAERAVKLAILPPELLAEQYRSLPLGPADLANPLASKQTGALRRAALFQAAAIEGSPVKKARLAAALLEEAGKAGLRASAARALGALVAFMRPGPELAWFADDAAEVLVQSNQGTSVDGWAALNRDLDHWRVLGALAGGTVPDAGALAGIERIARAGRMDAPHLHRLVTVLDALDVQIPIPLWEAASRTPQPADGHLPATGVLAELKMASDKREGARVILRAAEAMGPARANNANLLTLGDVIRALKSAGFVREARALGLEALIERWPRAAGG